MFTGRHSNHNIECITKLNSVKIRPQFSFYIQKESLKIKFKNVSSH